MNNYPRWFTGSLIGTFAAVVTTGLLLAPTTLALRAEFDAVWRLPATARLGAAALHAAGAFALLLFTGALWSVHMRSGWRRRRQRASGLGLALLLLGLSITALGVYYLGDDRLGAFTALLHLGLGFVLPAPMLWHWLQGRRIRHRHRTRASGGSLPRQANSAPDPNPHPSPQGHPQGHPQHP